MPRVRGKRPNRPGESVGEDLRAARRTSLVPERDELDLKAFVRQRRAIEAAMERDEVATAEPLGELLPCVEVHSVRRPMRAERDERLVEARAVDPLAIGHPLALHLLSVAAVLRRQHLSLLEDGIVIAIGPPVVAAAPNLNELLRRQHGVFLDGKELWPVLEQHVTPVLDSIELVVPRVYRERDHVAQPGRIAVPVALRLVRAPGVEHPDACT